MRRSPASLAAGSPRACPGASTINGSSFWPGLSPRKEANAKLKAYIAEIKAELDRASYGRSRS